MDELIGCVVAAAIIVVVAVVGVGYSISKHQCYTRYADFEPEYKGIITGCMVKYDGKTIPTESLRIME